MSDDDRDVTPFGQLDAELADSKVNATTLREVFRLLDPDRSPIDLVPVDQADAPEPAELDEESQLRAELAELERADRVAALRAQVDAKRAGTTVPLVDADALAATGKGAKGGNR